MLHKQHVSAAECLEANASFLQTSLLSCPLITLDELKIILDHIQTIQKNPRQSVNYSIFAEAYVHSSEPERIALLNLLFSLNPNQAAMYQFAKALCELDDFYFRDFPRFLYDMKVIGYNNNHVHVVEHTLFLLDSDLYINKGKNVESFRLQVYRESVKLDVLERLQLQSQRMLKLSDRFNLFKSSSEPKVEANERLQILIADPSLRIKKMGQSSRNTYTDVIEFWMKEKVVIADSGEMSETADIICDERNKLKKIGLFSKSPSSLEGALQLIKKDYGNICLPEDCMVSSKKFN